MHLALRNERPITSLDELTSFGALLAFGCVLGFLCSALLVVSLALDVFSFFIFCATRSRQKQKQTRWETGETWFSRRMRRTFFALVLAALVVPECTAQEHRKLPAKHDFFATSNENANASCAVRVSDPKVERRATVVGQAGGSLVNAVATAEPRFSWILLALDASARSIFQESYQIQAFSAAPTNNNGKALPVAADAAQSDAVLWDTGRVHSNATLEIAYAGSPLRSDQQVWWRVRVWTTGPSSSVCETSSEWSDITTFRVGRLNASSDWVGQWIGQPGAEVPDPSDPCSFYQDRPNSLLRNVFSVDETTSAVSAATLYITGLGCVDIPLAPV